MIDVSANVSALIIGAFVGFTLPGMGEIIGNYLGRIGEWRALFMAGAFVVSIVMSQPCWFAAIFACTLGMWQFWIHYKGKIKIQ